MINDEKMPVRMAQKEDLDSLMMLAAEHVFEMGLEATQTSILYSYDLFSKAISYEKSLIGVIGPVGSVFAYIVLQIYPIPYSGEEILDECGTFIKKEMRSSSHKYHISLIDFAKEASNNLHLRLKMNLLFDNDNARPQVAMRLYRKHFGGPVCASYIYDPNKELSNHEEVI